MVIDQFLDNVSDRKIQTKSRQIMSSLSLLSPSCSCVSWLCEPSDRQTSSGDFSPSLFPFHSVNPSQWNLFTTKCTIDCIISLFCSAVGILSCFTHLVRFKAAYTLLHIILFPTLPVGLNIIRKTGALTFEGVYWIFFFLVSEHREF